MIDVIIVLAVVLIVAGLAAAVLLGKRKSVESVAVGSRDGGSGALRTTVEQSYDSTGPVEVITASHPPPAARAGAAVPAAPAPTAAAAAAHGPIVSPHLVPVAETPQLFDLDFESDLAPPAPEIRWAAAFDSRSGTLDDIARLRLIGDLGVVAKEWCVPLLCQAYEEERRPTNRQAALIALATCRSRAAIPTYRLALASGDSDEAAIAADALADLEPPAQIKPRTVVERR